MAIDSSNQWSKFIDELILCLERFQRNEINMDQAFEFVSDANAAVLKDDELRQAIDDVVSEIDGFPNNYRDLIGFLKRQPSQDELRNYLL